MTKYFSDHLTEKLCFTQVEITHEVLEKKQYNANTPPSTSKLGKISLCKAYGKNYLQ